MPPTTEEASSWDFAPVIDLLYSFSADTQLPRHDVNGDLPSVDHEVSGGEQLQNGDAVHDQRRDPKLGDFGALFTFLAQSSPSDVADDARLSPDWRLNDDRKNVTEPAVKDNICDSLIADVKAEDDVFTTSPTKRKGKAKNLVWQNPSLEKKHAQKHLDPASVISISSGTNGKIANGKLHGQQEPSDPFSKTPIKILARPAPPQAPKSSVIELNEPSPFKTPRPVYSNLYPTPQKPPRSPPKSRPQIRPVVTASVTERRSRLVQKLIGKFPEQRKILLKSNYLLPTGNAQKASADSIHVFVDASNIMIGFHDCIKTSRNIPVTTRIPRVPLSFYNFSLVLERGRPPAKRVLVGSDRFPAIQEAERIGYEANILDRVHKSKDFTPAWKKFRDGKNGYGNCIGNGNSNSNGLMGQCSSGSETNGAPAPEKWVEQAVDEILHLKILESIVDTEKPSTMVLATGDAAEAEYSGGFMKMVTRALQKGWTIELVSFSQNTSATYKRKEFRSKWGSKFKMIELDGYIEELLDM